MSRYTVDDFLGDARRIVRQDGIRDGLESIRKNTEKLLGQSDLLETYVNMDEYEGHTVIGHDSETDIHVIVHGGRKGGTSPPHDHGPCSVIYGNYTGHTRMRRWNRLDDGGSEGPARLEVAREYTVGAGQATAFAEGDIHSIDYPDGAFFVRVTVGDVEKQKTHRFDLERGIVEIDDRAARTG